MRLSSLDPFMSHFDSFCARVSASLSGEKQSVFDQSVCICLLSNLVDHLPSVSSEESQQRQISSVPVGSALSPSHFFLTVCQIGGTIFVCIGLSNLAVVCQDFLSLQWNLRTRDTLEPIVVSLVERLSLALIIH